jgi:hypothetical protein
MALMVEGSFKRLASFGKVGRRREAGRVVWQSDESEEGVFR